MPTSPRVAAEHLLALCPRPGSATAARRHPSSPGPTAGPRDRAARATRTAGRSGDPPQHRVRAPLELLARKAPVAEPERRRRLRADRALGLPRRLLLRPLLRRGPASAPRWPRPPGSSTRTRAASGTRRSWSACPSSSRSSPRSPTSRSRGLRENGRKRWPALREVPWFPAVGDGACSNVGCGCTRNDRLALMVGTSGAMRVLWTGRPRRGYPDGPWCYRADARGSSWAARSPTAGTSIEPGCARRSGSQSSEETERLLSEMEPDSHGLTFLPLLAGERGPAGPTRPTAPSPGSR